MTMDSSEGETVSRIQDCCIPCLTNFNLSGTSGSTVKRKAVEDPVLTSWFVSDPLVVALVLAPRLVEGVSAPPEVYGDIPPTAAIPIFLLHETLLI